MNKYDKEHIYDDRIAPLMEKVYKICQQEGIPMAAQFYLQDESKYSKEIVKPLFCTSFVLPEERGKERGMEHIRFVAKRAMKYNPSSFLR